MRFPKLALPVLALAATAVPAAAGVAVPAEEVVTVRIAFADIDISTTEGRAMLEKRVDKQVREACVVESNLRFRDEAIDERCVAEARAAAFAQIERFATAEARSGRTVAAN